ncbi:hypothetical protein JM93_01328 [Roseibium hamelinense]|uniref:Uncharacterized protein n=1 Tax=Roseibium hamelinense TaxID=150831 RepID=A0A562T9K0_9HYPH|nr:hypothetical protein JM93_01328 [Roseibium hamelinense]
MEFRVIILSAIVKKLKRQSKEDFKGRQFEAWLIIQSVLVLSQTFIRSRVVSASGRSYPATAMNTW